MSRLRQSKAKNAGDAASVKKQSCSLPVSVECHLYGQCSIVHAAGFLSDDKIVLQLTALRVLRVAVRGE